ncbi:MAG: PAS domain-containing protein [Chloroflexia bacterium]|nr:PAS domain-containing protein [Chloroflexia bacterium]
MTDEQKSRAELLQELSLLRRRVVELESAADSAPGQIALAVLDSMHDMFAYYDPDLIILWANEASAASVGQNAADLLGRHCYEVWHQRDVPCVDCPVVRALETGRPQEAEITSPDGRLWHIRGYPVRDELGQIVALAEFTQNITVQRQMEQALCESEAQLRQITAQIPAIVYQFLLRADGGYKMLYLNEGCYDLLGLRPEEIQADLDLLMKRFLPGDRELVREIILEPARQVGDYCLDVRILGADDDVIWLRVHASRQALENGDVLWNGVAIDISKRKEMERAGQQQADMLNALYETALVLNSTLELDQVLDLILRQLRQVIPYDSASIQRLREDQLEIVACQGWGEPEKIVGLVFPLTPGFPNHRVVQSKQPLAIEDAAGVYPVFGEQADIYGSGHIRSWLGVPLIVKEQLIGMVTLDRATVRAYTQEEIQLALAFANLAVSAIENARLYGDLRQQMAQLRRTQAQLVQSAKLAAVGELAAGVAHEINNPLTSVLGYAEILQEESAGQVYGQELAIIAREARRARDIIRNLLRFAREVRPQRSRCDVNALIQETLNVVRYHLETGGITIQEVYAPDLVELELDPGQIKQVVLNLISNAAQAMPEGGTLCLQTVLREDSVAISISDTGRGIAAENLERIFDPFFSTRVQGIGLGLSLSLGLIEEHGGHIDVESQAGQGSTFTVCLPIG